MREIFAASLLFISVIFAGCGSGDKSERPESGIGPILLFNGRGTSPNDVAAFERILKSKQVHYTTASSAELNRMSEPEIGKYRLLIVPGGNFEEIGKNLSSNARANIREAVRGGCNYLGICAGAFLAGNSP